MLQCIALLPSAGEGQRRAAAAEPAHAAAAAEHRRSCHGRQEAPAQAHHRVPLLRDAREGQAESLQAPAQAQARALRDALQKAPTQAARAVQDARHVCGGVREGPALARHAHLARQAHEDGAAMGLRAAQAPRRARSAGEHQGDGEAHTMLLEHCPSVSSHSCFLCACDCATGAEASLRPSRPLVLSRPTARRPASAVAAFATVHDGVGIYNRTCLGFYL